MFTSQVTPATIHGVPPGAVAAALSSAASGTANFELDGLEPVMTAVTPY
jgi:hypothetical protein